MKSPIPYYGAKAAAAQRIAALLPSHEAYVEPFAGSASVFFAKSMCDRALLSDLNPWPLASLRAIRDMPANLICRFPEVPFDVPAYVSKAVSGTNEKVISALPPGYQNADWRQAITHVRNMSLVDSEYGDVPNAITQHQAWGLAFNSTPWSGSQSARMSVALARKVRSGEFADCVWSGADVLDGVCIELADAIEVIDDQRGALIFCDPPYMRFEQGGGSRGAAYAGYGPFDPEAEWHNRFLDSLDGAISRGCDVVMTTGKDALYEERCPSIGLSLVDDYGTEGRGPGRGGTATAKHLIWATRTSRML